jgi:phosphate transport system protein
VAHTDTEDRGPSRSGFQADLDELRLQVEVMALRVGTALDGATEILRRGDEALAVEVIAADDDIDAMLVSLSTRCYELLARQSPVASDLRLVVSVLRILTEFERIGDLCLRIAHLAAQQPIVASDAEIFEILQAMAGEATELYRSAVDAWSTRNAALAVTLAGRDDALDTHYARLTEAILALTGPDAVPRAVAAVTIGRTLERIADHAVLIGVRLRYLLTGDPRFLTEEAR